jgi:hypothetical protein
MERDHLRVNGVDDKATLEKMLDFCDGCNKLPGSGKELSFLS